MKQYECLVITAHPDDAFICMGGTILKIKNNGLTPYIISVSDGNNLGSLNNVRIDEFFNTLNGFELEGDICNFQDGMLAYYEKELFLYIVEKIKEFNPKIIITHSMHDSHSDHSTVAGTVNKAIQRVFHILREQFSLCVLMYSVPVRLDMETIPCICPNILCDISSYVHYKRKLAYYHKSQNPYIDLNVNKHIALNKFLGALSSCEYAEAFEIKEYAKNYTIRNILGNI